MTTPETFTGTTDMAALYDTEVECAVMNLVLYVTADWSNDFNDALEELTDMPTVIAGMVLDEWKCHALTLAEPGQIAEKAAEIIRSERAAGRMFWGSYSLHYILE